MEHTFFFSFVWHRKTKFILIRSFKLDGITKIFQICIWASFKKNKNMKTITKISEINITSPHKIQILDSMSPQNSNFGQHISTKFKFYQHHNKWEWKHTIWNKIQVQFQAKYKSNFNQNTSPWDTHVYHKFEVRPH